MPGGLGSGVGGLRKPHAALVIHYPNRCIRTIEPLSCKTGALPPVPHDASLLLADGRQLHPS